MMYTCYMLPPPPSLMSYQASSDTVPSQHTNTTATARILLEQVRATESTSRHTQTNTEAAVAEQKSIKNMEQHLHRNSRVACLLLTVYSMVPLGLWNDMRLPSFFSGVFFWPVSVSKRGKVRITFMFPSPQLVTSCRFPAPWVDSSFVNSERASQPASNVSCERRTTCSLSLSLSLSFSLCIYSLALALSLSHCPPLAHSFSPVFLLAHCTAQWQPLKVLHLAFLPLSHLTADRNKADLHQGTVALDASTGGEEEDGFGGKAGCAKAGDARRGKVGAELGGGGGWRKREGSVLCVGWVMRVCCTGKWQPKTRVGV